jgi:hypothetical protein
VVSIIIIEINFSKLLNFKLLSSLNKLIWLLNSENINILTEICYFCLKVTAYLTNDWSVLYYGKTQWKTEMLFCWSGRCLISVLSILLKISMIYCLYLKHFFLLNFISSAPGLKKFYQNFEEENVKMKLIKKNLQNTSSEVEDEQHFFFKLNCGFYHNYRNKLFKAIKF